MKRQALIGLMLAVLLSTGATTTVCANVTSTFDTGSEGWTISDGLLNHHISGGNPGGFVSARDNSEDDSSLFMGLTAPDKFLGNMSDYLYGTLSFDVMNMSQLPPDLDGFGAVFLFGPDGIVAKDIVPVGEPAPFVGWQTFSLDLDPDLWAGGVALPDLLANLGSIRVALEFLDTMGGEAVGFDNFAFTLSEQPVVPVPGALWLLSSGLLGLAKFRKRLLS